MNYGALASISNDTADKLINELSKNDILYLASFLKEKGKKEYLSFAFKNQNKIYSFLLASPLERAAFIDKEDYDKSENLMLYLASIQWSKVSAAFLHNLYENEFDDGLLFPAIIHRAFQAYYLSLSEIDDPYDYWPFEKTCPSPFETYSPLNDYTYNGYEI